MSVISKKILVSFLLFDIITNLFSYVTNAATLIVEENKFFTCTADKMAYRTRKMQPLYQWISLIQREEKDSSNNISISASSKEMEEPKEPAINQSTKANRLVKAGDDTILVAFQGVGVGLICLFFMWRWEKRKKKKSHSSKKSDE